MEARYQEADVDINFHDINNFDGKLQFKAMDGHTRFWVILAGAMMFLQAIVLGRITITFEKKREKNEGTGTDT